MPDWHLTQKGHETVQVDNPEKKIPTGVTFFLGGIAGIISSSIMYPIDMTKNRVQITRGGSAIKIMKKIVRCDGFFALYRGIDAAILRQATYTTTRLGLFTKLCDYYTGDDGTPPSFALKTGLGFGSGLIASLIGNPFDVVLTRMTLDSALPCEDRRNYRHIFHGLYSVSSQEGVAGLWTGASVSLVRAGLSNSAMLATYAQSKEVLVKYLHFEPGIPLFFCSSMLSGFFTTCFVLPADQMKTRVQSVRMIDGKPEFTIPQIFQQVIALEGIPALWKGFAPYFLRIAPYTTMTFIFLEEFKYLYRHFSS